MDEYKDPFFAVIRCEMCINPVTNFVVGLCSRCEKMWTTKRLEHMVPISNNRIKAAIVASLETDATMDPTFQAAMTNAKMKKAQKNALFQKIRGQFAGTVLTVDEDSKMAVPCKTEDNYWYIPEVMDKDLRKFQRNVDLLADMVPDRSRSPTDEDITDQDTEDSSCARVTPNIPKNI
ncbi:uncharacterized protein LOC117897266 [Drosophila subobscura]|uniref:uncharacterized protein LOC117897266 n=1 Tax=Drosophila subobscura TaxID=7241 RepID=UPI00155A2445|nr:uncharacterized protein LOC117897266 [Drosophila subobscura]